jgi:O-antigen/teichoic acid export membrane protein
LNSLQNIIQGSGRITQYNQTRIFKTIIEFFLVLILLLAFRQGIGGAVISNIIAIIAATIISIILVKKISKFYFYLNKKLLKDSLVYGGKVYFANTASFLNYRLDMFLIAILLEPEIALVGVGVYSIAVAISEKLFMIPGALATVLFPKISSIKSSEANEFTPKVVRHTFFIMIVSSLVMAALVSPFINIFFGSDFLGAVKPFLILLPGIIAFGIGGVMAADLSGRGKPEFAVYSSFTCLVINVILNIILIPLYGISGAAIASAIGYWADTLVIIIAFRNISKKPLSEFLLIKKQDFKDYIRVFKNFREVWKTN